MVKTLLTGDLLLHSRYGQIADTLGPAYVFEHVSNLFKDSHLTFVNLEIVLSDKGEAAESKLCLRGSPKYLQQLQAENIDVVSLANNHAFDFGFEGFEDMQTRLEGLGIQTVGAGPNLKSSRNLKTLTIDGITFGFLAYSSRTTNGSTYASEQDCGVAPLEEDLVLADISQYRDQVDHLILSLHWGVEYAEFPTPDQRNLGRKFIEAGARVIYGHHPHILQGYEKWNDGVIFYSLGNFCDSDLVIDGSDKQYQAVLKIADRETVLVHLEFGPESINDIQFTPLWLNDAGQPEVATNDKKAEILDKLSRRSALINQPDFEKYWEKVILDKRVGGAFRAWLRRGSLLDKVKNFKFSQFISLWDLIEMFLKTKFSKSEDKYFLLNPGDDKKPRPYCGDDDK